MRLAFRFRKNFPSVIQIREIAFSEIDRPRSKRFFTHGRLRHAFEPPTQSFVHNLFQSRISFFLNLLEKGRDIIVET